MYSLGKNVSMDEAMIPIKGRSSLKQYMPKKLVRRGIKVWALADSENGYIANFQVHTGKQGDSTEKAKVVKTLTAPYVNSIAADMSTLTIFSLVLIYSSTFRDPIFTGVVQ